MKKIISVLICTVMAFSAINAEAFAVKKNIPTVLISGFMCSQLYLDFGEENQKKVWGIEVGDVFGRIKDDFSNLAKSTAGLLIGRKDNFAATLGEGAAAILEKLSCLPDGTSEYNIGFYPNNPQTSNLEYMLSDENRKKYLYEIPFCEYYSTVTDPSHVFVFQYDSRMDPFTISENLRSYIKAIKEYTGAEKVNVFALSYGGLITSTYLTRYGSEKDVGKAVMSVPALGGTDIPYRIFTRNIDFPLEVLIKFFETATRGESNFARFFEYSERLEGLGDFAQTVCSEGLTDIIKYWPSIWALCSTEYYEGLKAEILDPVENKLIIDAADKVHYEVMENLPETFAACKENGTEIFILCSTGSSICLGGENNGDAVLPAKGVSGATCAPLGKRFANGYQGVKTSCSDPSHNHISPSMEIDASSAYLPENTWFVDGQYHGQYYYEDYTRSLVTKLLLTDEIKDIYSDPDYPQFEISNHSYRTVYAGFDKSLSGFINSKDKTLNIKNISDSNHIKILSVIADGVNLEFDVSDSGFISSGETAFVPFSGELPDEGSVYAGITVNYIEIGSLTPFCSSHFDFTVSNGEAVGYSGGYSAAKPETMLKKNAPEWLYNFLEKTSLRQGVECIYDTIYNKLK